MYRILLIILLTIGSYYCHAQDYPFNDTNWWQRLSYEEQPSADISQTDTSIIVVSNRYKTDNSLRFMSEIRGEGDMMYFFVYASKGLWHVLKVKDMNEAISYIPDINRDWVVYTEGMGKIFTSELNRGMMMSAQYGVNIIMLDYPSITTTKKIFGNYLFSIRNAKAAYKDHVPVLKQIEKNKLNGKLGIGNISLFFHSMGNYMVMQLAKKGKLQEINDTVWADNIILNSACVPQHKHAKWLGKYKFASEIYVNYNPEDGTLKWPELLNKKKQLGRRLKKPLCKKAHYLNFHNLVGEGHSYFLSLQGRSSVNPTVWKYYNTILHGRPVDLKSEQFNISSYRSLGFDVLPD